MSVATTLGLASQAHAEEPPAKLRQGLSDDEPVFKWSAPTLDEGGWVIGLSTLGYGLTDRVTVGTRTSEVVLGHYNAQIRVAVGSTDSPAVSVEGGVGAVTPVAIAALFVPTWEARPVLGVAEVGVPLTWTVGTGRFVTVRPWFGLAFGAVEDDDEQLTLLIGRPVLTGPGVTLIGEGHLARRLGLVGKLDLGLELYGQQIGVVVRPGAAAVLATGPLRVNLGLAVGVAVDRQGTLRTDLQPAVDIWVRL